VVRREDYRPRPIPQALGSSGAHVGTGRTLTRAAVNLFWVEADEICVEATAPVRTRTATKARTMFFMDWAPFYMIVSKLQKISIFRRNANVLTYRPRPIPQAFGSSGAHVGTGRTLTRAAVTLFWVDAEEICVEATAPVRTRTATKARTICFIVGYP